MGLETLRKSVKVWCGFCHCEGQNEHPPVYTVFFKAKDADAITNVLKEYSAKQMKKQAKKTDQASWKSLRSSRRLWRKPKEGKGEEGRSTSDEKIKI